MFNPRILTGTTPTKGTSNKHFGSNPTFMKTFNSMLKKTGSARSRAVPGQDMARGLGQAKASVAGRNNKRAQIMPSVDPVSAALQHSVRNRSMEQGGNAASGTALPAGGSGADSSIFKFLQGSQ